MDRRTFLLSVGAAGLASACVTIPTLHLEPSDDGVIRVPRSEFEARAYEGRFMYVNPGNAGPHLLLTLREDGSVLALSTRCTHLGCRVRASGGSIRCPCHGATFSLSGEVLRGPATRPLETFPTHEDDVDIVIAIGGTP